MTGEGVGEGNSGDPVLGVEGKRSLSSQRPDAEEQIRLSLLRCNDDKRDWLLKSAAQ